MRLDDNKNIAIKISNVKKKYKLGQIGGGTLQADIQSWWAKKRGKIDPNSKIGQQQRLVGSSFMALNGIDISNWQSGINLAVVPCDFVVIKATEGTGYVNPDYERAYRQAKTAGKCLGIYY